jgi:hypothetical protein
MKGADSKSDSSKEGHVDKLACPVAGHIVAVTSKYKPGETGQDKLTYFACTMEGRCGISLWDPCPLFIDHLEKRGPQND